MNIGTAIKQLRKERRMSQEELALVCGLSVNSISQIETNNAFPHKKNFDKICRVFDVNQTEFLVYAISDIDVEEKYKPLFDTMLDSIIKITKL